MRIAARVALAAVLTAGMVATTAAQPPAGKKGGAGRGGNNQPGGGMRMGGGGGSIYGMVGTNKALQEELKVTDEQKTALKEAMKPINEARQEMMKGFTPGERPSEEAMKEMREKGEKLTADTKVAVEKVLKAEQTKRLTEIGYQQMGLIGAVTNKDAIAALKITDEQKDKFKAIADEFRKDSMELMRSAFGGGGGDREEMMKKMEENRKKTDAMKKEAEEKLTAKMTDDQKKTWTEIQGAKFDVSKLNAFGGGRPRRDD